MDGNCRVCGEEFEMGKNVFTQAGVLETRITKFCEKCFDACTSEESSEENTDPHEETEVDPFEGEWGEFGDDDDNFRT